MHEDENTGLVESLFTAFKRGDMDTVLGAIDEDVVWDVPGPPHIPFAGRRFGMDQVREFFRVLGKSVRYTSFEPREYVAQGDKVAVAGAQQSAASAQELRSQSEMLRCVVTILEAMAGTRSGLTITV